MWMFVALACVRAPDLPPAEPVPAAAPEPADPTALLPWMIREDPLVRHPRLPAATGEDPALAAFVALARDDAATADAWRGLEAAWPGTAAVALARGARLGAQEASGSDVDSALDALLPLSPPDPAAARTRDPLAWAGVTSAADLLPIGERGVLLGWLDGPGIDVTRVVTLLGSPDWGRLADTPAGQLLRARAHADPAAGATGRAALADATGWALRRTAADRTAEVSALAAEKARLAAAYGASGDPLGAMLAAARRTLVTDGAGSTGVALVALTAERLNRSCPDAPCAGLDRGLTLRAASRWGGEAAAYAAVWEVVALKSAVDHLDVAYDEPSFPSALDEVLDALVGVGRLDRSLLLQARPGPGVHLTLVRALGAADATAKEAMFQALYRRLLATVDAATAALDAAPTVGSADWREPLARVRRRSEAALGPSRPLVTPPAPSPR